MLFLRERSFAFGQLFFSFKTGLMVSTKYIDIHGHRGARGLFPENTLTAFEGALKMGVDALELDVVISKDLEVVVSHEAWMNSLFCTRPDGHPVENDPDKYNLFHMTYPQIAAYDCGKRGNAEFPSQEPMPERKPLLREVFTRIESYAHAHGLKPISYNIEIKTEQPSRAFNPDPLAFVDLVYNAVKSSGAFSRCAIQSFDVEVLRCMKQKDASMKLGLLVENRDGFQVNLDRLNFKPDVYSPDFEMMDAGLVEKIHTLGIRFIPWTVNEPKDIQQMIDLGVDGIITDYPDRAITLVRTN